MLLVIVLALLLMYTGVSADVAVVEVDHRNIENFLEHQPVILEFYAPWCKHCKNFELPYQQVARGIQKEEYMAGKVDIDASPAVASRFGVRSIPAFYLIRDNKVWKIQNRRTIESLMEFCLQDYVREPSMGLLTSPLGPVGRLKGFMTHLGGKAIDYMAEWSNYMKVPIFVPYVVVAIAMALSILLCTFVGIYYSITHVKMD